MSLPDTQKDAFISDCGKYRYWLMRVWDPDKPCLDCVMLNPSKADAEIDDATIRRLVGFADRRGYGSIRVYNLFAYRATQPLQLELVPDPVGPDNDDWIRSIRGTVLCAWGNNKWPSRGIHVTKLLRAQGCQLLCLGKTLSGQPKHPSRLPYGHATWESM